MTVAITSFFWKNLADFLHATCKNHLLQFLTRVPSVPIPPILAEVGVGAFSRFRAREREAKKRVRKREEKRARKKAEAPIAKEKNAQIRTFSSPHSGNPVSEPKAAWQGESKGLE